MTPSRPLHTVFTARSLAVIVGVLSPAALTGCPDDGPGAPADTNEGLPDGATCEPGAVVSCVEEGEGEARFCNASGTGTFVESCPGENAACRLSRCYDLPPGAICIPGEVKECVAEGSKEALLCNQSGTAFVPGVCTGPDGNESQCRSGACTECFPGTRKCLDDQTVLECNAEGTGYEVYQTCEQVSHVCTGQFCEALCERNAKFSSYIGCDYFAADLDNGWQGVDFAVAVANPPDSPLPATVKVERLEGGVVEEVTLDSFGNPFPTDELAPGELRVYRMPRRHINGTIIGPLAYRFNSTVPVIAYQFNPLENEEVYSNDASLLLPASLLGQEYYVMTREQTFWEIRSYLTVIAVMDGETSVSVTTNYRTQVGRAHEGTDAETEIRSMEPGETRVFKLKQFEVLSLQTSEPGADPTGSRIVADKRVAVFGGSEGANAPNTAKCTDIDAVTGFGVCEWDGRTQCRTLMDCVNAGFNTCCADHIEQQMFPLKTWGSRFVATKTWDRGEESDIWRIMAAEDNTRVLLVPPQPGVTVPVLNRGEHFEFDSRNDFEIVAADNKPLMVGQFLAAQDAPGPNVGGADTSRDAGTGDPAFMLQVGVEQYRNDFVILVPAEYAENFVNITAPTGALVLVDDEPIDASDFTLIGTGEYSVIRRRLEPGAHTIRSTERAGVIVYGWDQYVSYAYTGGLNLEAIRDESPAP